MLSTDEYHGRSFEPRNVRVEPNYVIYRRLLFQQNNFERYGWDLGPLSPGFELGTYYYDLVMLPYHIGSNTCRYCDTSAGKALPGDPVPLMIRCEPFSITGLVFQAGAVVGGAFAFP